MGGGDVRQRDLLSRPEVELAWLDRSGVITAVNGDWRTFCAENDGDPAACGPGVSYLDVCDADPHATPVAAAIRDQLAGSLAHPAVFTVPCDGPLSAHWYDVHVSPRLGETGVVEGAAVALVPVSPSLSDLTSELPVTDLVEGPPDGDLLVDAEGDIKYVNGQLLRRDPPDRPQSRTHARPPFRADRGRRGGRAPRRPGAAPAVGAAGRVVERRAARTGHRDRGAGQRDARLGEVVIGDNGRGIGDRPQHGTRHREPVREGRDGVGIPSAVRRAGGGARLSWRAPLPTQSVTFARRGTDLA
jgi:hypothetical protein